MDMRGIANTSDANTSKIDDLGLMELWLVSFFFFHFSRFFSGEKMKHVDQCMVHRYMTWSKRGSCMQIMHHLR